MSTSSFNYAYNFIEILLILTHLLFTLIHLLDSYYHVYAWGFKQKKSTRGI